MMRSKSARYLKKFMVSAAVFLVSAGVYTAVRDPSAISRIFNVVKTKPYEPEAFWEEDFDVSKIDKKSGLPEGWVEKGKFGTPKSEFSVLRDGKGGDCYLKMVSDSSSSSLVTFVEEVDLRKTPVLSWKWRVITLPEGADGRYREKDDQAVGLYVGTGSTFSQKTISYRWDTDTPAGATGEVSYGGGITKVKWMTLRNREDVDNGKWYVERRNILNDFREAWGFVPEKVYISVSSNSQYTGTRAEADIDWIEIVPAVKTM